MSAPGGELHERPPAEFEEQVRSFEFWFGSVQGYLEGLEYGHSPGAEDLGMPPAERERLVRVLCNYCVGETAALEGAGGLIACAPNRASKIFLATQTADEARHLEVLTHRLRELGVDDPEAEIAQHAAPGLREFKQRLLQLVAAGDWPAALFAQNVILETLEFTVFQRHLRSADALTREVLLGVIKDERRHLGFGENEIGRQLWAQPSLRARLVPVREELDRLVLASFEHVLAALAAPASERSDLGRDYLGAVARLGFA